MAGRRGGMDAQPASEAATSGVVWRGRASRSCGVASFPLGAGGARPRVDGAPRPPGSVRSGRTPGASAKTDPLSGGPRVRVPVSRVLISGTGGTPGCGVRADRARGSGTQAHPVEGRGRARDRHVHRRDPAPHRDVWGRKSRRHFGLDPSPLLRVALPYGLDSWHHNVLSCC